MLARFQLTDIRPAPRGEPQIEVTFDIDANGILNVTARDKDTGAEQSITISETSTLDQSEVERMVQEAESNRAADVSLRQEIDARNELDATAYQVNVAWTSSATRLPPTSGPARRCCVTDARQAVADQAPIERTRELTTELQGVLSGLRAVSTPGRHRRRPTAGTRDDAGSTDTGADDDVIDAEFHRG